MNLRVIAAMLLGVWLCFLPEFAIAQQAEAETQLISLKPPGDREFVRDQAHLLTDADVAKIKQIADKLLTEKATPIIVVTIDSMAEHGGAGMRIETFARLLFDQWKIGVAKLNGQDWNTGILLLVSKGDRKARIELGGYWRREQDQQCQQIMEQIIVPRFKQGDFSGGILAGVEALDKMAHGLPLPKGSERASQPPSTMAYVLIAVAVGLGIFTLVSMIRKGSSGWAWLLWAAVFGLVGFLLYQFLTSSSSNGGSGGGYSGGSFDGGFSGGGGTTGSW